MAGLNKGLSETQKNIDAIDKSLNAMTHAMLDSGEGFGVILDGLDGMASGLKSGAAALEAIIGKIPGLGGVGGAVGDIAGVFGKIAEAGAKAAKMYGGIIKGLDGFSQPTRKLEKDMYNLAAQFGGTFEEGQEMARFMLDYADEVATKDFGYINLAETNKAAKAFMTAKIPIENFGKSIETTAGSMDILSVGILHAQALGLDSTRYFNLMGNAILKQGLSAQDAAEQMAMFGDMASVTGLSVDTIADSLHSLTGKFTKLGLTADFGRPLLEGFARTLTGMGLGIENATSLAEGLGEALAGLTENYSMAYVVAQRGGLDFGGGGGALGASIGLQAKMLDAEKPGGDQAGLALEMAGAMKETLESFTGGSIITVKEAAASPELENAFYMQQKLLEQMFGLDSKTATRTLDYLSQLDEVTASGDKDLIDSLGEQLNEAINTRDKTMDEMDKLNATSVAQLSQLQIQSTALFNIMRSTSSDLRALPEGLIEKAVVGAKGKTAGLEDNMKNFQNLINQGLDKLNAQAGIDTDKSETPRATTPLGGKDNSMEELKRMHTKLLKNIDFLVKSMKVGIDKRGDWLGGKK